MSTGNTSKPGFRSSQKRQVRNPSPGPKTYLHNVTVPQGIDTRLFVSDKWDTDPTNYKRIEAEMRTNKITHVIGIDVSSTSYFGDLASYQVHNLSTTTMSAKDANGRERVVPLKPYAALQVVACNFLELFKAIFNHHKYDQRYTRRVDHPNKELECTVIHNDPSTAPYRPRVMLYGPESSVSVILILYLMNLDENPMDLNTALRTLVVSWGGAQLEPEYLRAFQKYEITERDLPKGSPTSFIIGHKEYPKTKEDVIKLLRRRFVQ